MRRKEIAIMNEITEFCERNCMALMNPCNEEECILYRIEQIITEERKDKK